MLILTGRSTQKNINDAKRVLYYRTEEDITGVLSYVLLGNEISRPIFTGKSGFFTQNNDVNSILNEMLNVQKLFRKCDGIRVRHQIVSIDLSDFEQGLELTQVNRVALLMSQFYLFKGFQNVWSVLLLGNQFIISFVINTVSCFDGAKYHYNKNAVYDEEYSFLQGFIDLVVNRNSTTTVIDYKTLEFYPYSF